MAYLSTSCRLLNTQDLVKDFLGRTLEYNHSPNIINQIVDAEHWLVDNVPQPLIHTEGRWILRRQIVNELFYNTRLANDNDIRLGVGGSIPNVGVQTDGKIFIIIGPPASGKSTISEKVAEDYRACVLDSDYAKRKLPEYYFGPAGASVVHQEANGIINGFKGFLDEPNLLNKCIENNYNIVFPKVGGTPNSIAKIANAMITFGYEVHLLLVYVPKKVSTRRAVQRFSDTKRYVPLGLIFDHYGNDPIITYYNLKDSKPGVFTSFGAICTMEDNAACVDAVGDSPALKYGKKTLNWSL